MRRKVSSLVFCWVWRWGRYWGREGGKEGERKGGREGGVGDDRTGPWRAMLPCTSRMPQCVVFTRAWASKRRRREARSASVPKGGRTQREREYGHESPSHVPGRPVQASHTPRAHQKPSRSISHPEKFPQKNSLPPGWLNRRSRRRGPV
jgi:hypothetical protein